MRRSLVKFLIDSISDRILPRLRFGVFQQNRPKADNQDVQFFNGILVVGWRSLDRLTTAA
jgi:hypothetical protein